MDLLVLGLARPHMTEWQTLINRPVRVPQPNRVDYIPR